MFLLNKLICNQFLFKAACQSVVQSLNILFNAIEQKVFMLKYK